MGKCFANLGCIRVGRWAASEFNTYQLRNFASESRRHRRPCLVKLRAKRTGTLLGDKSWTSLNCYYSKKFVKSSLLFKLEIINWVEFTSVLAAFLFTTYVSSRKRLTTTTTFLSTDGLVSLPLHTGATEHRLLIHGAYGEFRNCLYPVTLAINSIFHVTNTKKQLSIGREITERMTTCFTVPRVLQACSQLGYEEISPEEVGHCQERDGHAGACSDSRASQECR